MILDEINKQEQTKDAFGKDHSIAILPFLNMSADPKKESFSDGLTEEIINALTQVKGLRVTARTSSFAFKGKELDVRLIGQQLGVNTVLEGSVRIEGKKVRITAQLIEVETGFHFWSKTFDRFLEDIFALQDEISLLIADKLREHLGHLEIADQLIEDPGVNFEIYQQYLLGKYYIQKFNKPDVEKGIEILHNLTQIQPEFAQPFLSINYAYTYLGALGLLPVEESFAKAKWALEKAIAINPNLPECHLRKAGLVFWNEWDIPKTYFHIQKTLEKQPANAEAHLWMGVALAVDQKFAAAHHYIDRALSMDPFSPLFNDFKAAAYYFEERYELAIQKFKHCLSLDPNFLMSHINLAAAEVMAGDLQAGFARFQNLPPSGESDLSRLGGAAIIAAMSKQEEQVKSGIKQLEKALETPLNGRAIFFLILVHIQLDNYEKALDWLEMGLKQKVSILITFHIEPFLKPLRHLPRFQELMEGAIQFSSESSPEVKKSSTTQLKPGDQAIFKHRLEVLMASEAPYLEPDLNLRKLAKRVDLHPNYLSRLINEQFDKNFSEYINSYRLEAFKAKAQDPANHHLTILSLAYDSGFNSKTVFNTFFKKKMGMTPREYWQRVVVG